jgi:subtilisin family serine protease
VSGLVGGWFFGVAKRTTIQMVKCLDCSGSGTVGTVVAALLAIDAHASVHNANKMFIINLSLNGPPSTSIASTLQDLLNAYHVMIVVAAGNSNDNACNYGPSGVSGVVALAASDMNDQRASFSNFGSCVSFYAPGVGVTSAWPGAQYAILSGTSMASPIAAGTALVVIEQVQRNYTFGMTSAALFIKQIMTSQASRPSTLDKPLVFTFFDATSQNNYGLPIPQPPGQPPPPPPPPPPSLEPTPPPFSAPVLRPAAQPNNPPNIQVVAASANTLVSFPFSNLGILWITGIWIFVLRLAN